MMKPGERADHRLGVTDERGAAAIALGFVRLAAREPNEQDAHDDRRPDDRDRRRVDGKEPEEGGRNRDCTGDERVCQQPQPPQDALVEVLEVRDLMREDRGDLIRREQFEQAVAEGDARLGKRGKRDRVHRVRSRRAVAEDRRAFDAGAPDKLVDARLEVRPVDRKSTRLNSSHGYISYAVFCLKKKKNKNTNRNYSTQLNELP